MHSSKFSGRASARFPLLTSIQRLAIIGMLVSLAACGGGSSDHRSGPADHSGGSADHSSGPADNSGDSSDHSSLSTINVTVSGLAGSGLILQNNGGDDLAVSANGSAAFASKVAEGGSYAVTVKSQPGAPLQGCTVSSGTGTVTSTGTVNVLVNCVSAHFAFVTALIPSTKTDVYAVNETTGAFTATGYSVPRGGFVMPALAPSGKFFYLPSATESAVRAYAINPFTGALTDIAGSPFSTGGTSPRNVAITPNGRFLYAGNRISNSVTVFAVDAANGTLTQVGVPVATSSQVWMVGITPDGRCLIVATGGNALRTYRIDATTGALTLLANVSVSATFKHIAIDPQSKFFYVTEENLSDNKVYGYTIDSTTGAVSAIPGSPFTAGQNPQFMAIDPAGKTLYVTNEQSNTISTFSLNPTTGVLSATGPALATGGYPESVVIDPNGKFVYVAGQTAGAIDAFAVDELTGALSPGISSSFYPTSPLVITILRP